MPRILLTQETLDRLQAFGRKTAPEGSTFNYEAQPSSDGRQLVNVDQDIYRAVITSGKDPEAFIIEMLDAAEVEVGHGQN